MITSLSQLDLNGTYTYADYLRWQLSEKVELIKGRIFRMAPAPHIITHQFLSQSIEEQFTRCLKGHSCRMVHAPADVKLARKNPATGEEETSVVQPDIFVVCDRSKLVTGVCLGAPDLVVEILSPGNRPVEMQEKYDLYEENSVREYWIVEPAYRTATVYVLNNEGKYTRYGVFNDTETLTSPTLEVITVNLKEVFDNL